ncbi:unnamed protein product, partial [Colletotrichum noveboracense]
PNFPVTLLVPSTQVVESSEKACPAKFTKILMAAYEQFTEYDVELEVPEKAVQELDENVRKFLPEKGIFKSMIPHGPSFWGRTARINIVEEDGSATAYFMKVCHGQRGHDMMLGEFTSMTAVHGVLPECSPLPIGWGTYESDAQCHFYLATFHEMAEELPDINAFAWKIAELHLRSESPNGKFGFPVTTFSGNAPQDNSWTDTWEAFFTKAFIHMIRLEGETQGRSEEMDKLASTLVGNVIPRLLRPMEVDGRTVKPCLIHGDLWYGNACTDLDTGNPIVFDACSLYGHHEYELGTWRSPHYRIGKPYVRAYHQKYPKSEPVEDWDDRNALYSM